ncbi:MAG: hypothetical protein CO108_28420 [Deltaproteobacteria bacterium CG_4_9_14_3_um_filter_63_12]|nr:MAG: hypothetical protein CO108_28420 [Deltaproteobacteria bacterium CG_4_9_14_3_um_filter_63_12]
MESAIRGHFLEIAPEFGSRAGSAEAPKARGESDFAAQPQVAYGYRVTERVLRWEVLVESGQLVRIRT